MARWIALLRGVVTLPPVGEGRAARVLADTGCGPGGGHAGRRVRRRVGIGAQCGNRGARGCVVSSRVSDGGWVSLEKKAIL